jgi:hypothetical protein
MLTNSKRICTAIASCALLGLACCDGSRPAVKGPWVGGATAGTGAGGAPGTGAGGVRDAAAFGGATAGAGAGGAAGTGAGGVRIDAAATDTGAGGSPIDVGRDAAGGSAAGAAGTAWNSPSTGNPFLPGYFADPSILYEAATSTFYVFATTDGNWIDYSSDPTVWSSTDFVHWKGHTLTLPSMWPKQPLWAPSVAKHPKNGKYYLLYAVNSVTFIAYADSPLGPWLNATVGTTADTAPLYNRGEMWGSGDGFDAQFFPDDDGTIYMTFGGGGSCGIAKLAFGTDFKVAIDNSDSRLTDGTVHKFKRLSGLTNYNEGSVMFKSGGRYFIAYSVDGCQNYNVQYAVGPSPIGPFTHATNSIVHRDDTTHILGPGHNSFLQYQGDTYIVYHRQHYQYVDVKRQTSIDKIAINGDTISANVQSHAGVWAGKGALESLVADARAAAEPNLAFGKRVLASSESDYKGGTASATRETFAAIKGFYAATFAVDQNLGTRWAPSSLPGTLIVDLGSDQAIGRCETTFEYSVRAYRYRIDYLPASDATDIRAAQMSAAWKSYTDRSTNTEKLSPIADSKSVTARYLRLTVLSADLPTDSSEIRTIVETDYADRVSLVEFEVFGAP